MGGVYWGKSFALTAKLQGFGKELFLELAGGLPHGFFTLIDDVPRLRFVHRLDHLVEQLLEVSRQGLP